MFLFKGKKTNNDSLILKIDGMHCGSCALNIDDSLELIGEIKSSNTNYARGETKIYYEPGTNPQDEAIKTIEELGYKVLIPQKKHPQV